MGVPRTRQRNQGYLNPQFKIRMWNPNIPANPDVDVLTYNQRVTAMESCFDTVESHLPFPPHDFNCEKIEYNPIFIHGQHTNGNGGNARIYFTGPNRNTITSIELADVPQYSVAGRFVDNVNWDYWRTLALANLNPNRPDVNVPAFVGELRELPRTLQASMESLMRRKDPNLIKRAGEDHLLWNFGWKPLLSDLNKMVNYPRIVNNRIDYLKRIAKGDRVGRSLGSRQFNPASGHNRTLINLAFTKPLLITAKSYGSTDVWFTATVNSNSIPTKAEDLKKLASDAAFGMSHSGSTLLSAAWELTPWSWLNDYYYNLGDFIEATRGGIPFKVTNMNIMARSYGFELLKISNSSSFKVEHSGFYSTFEKKQRKFYAYPYPMPTYKPGLTSGQLANLAALLASSGRTRSSIGRL